MAGLTRTRSFLGTDRGWGFILIDTHRRSSRGFDQGWRSQNHYALNVVRSGSGELLSADGTRHRLQAGSVYQHLPDAEARLRWDDATVDEAFMVLDHRTWERFDAFAVFPSVPAFDGAHGDWVEARLQEAAEALRDLGQPQLGRCNRPALAIVASLLAALFQKLEPPVAARSRDVLVSRACHELQLRPGDRTELPELARRLGVSYARLRKRFTQAIGLSLARYRIRVRMQAAQRLLLDHDVQTTAAHLGYADAFSFSAQFKREVGKSPRDYRLSVGKGTRR
ncbi:MAG: helix-turn-helix transcriptional regulator [Opitutales bacterium]